MMLRLVAISGLLYLIAGGAGFAQTLPDAPSPHAAGTATGAPSPKVPNSPLKSDQTRGLARATTDAPPATTTDDNSFPEEQSRKAAVGDVSPGDVSPGEPGRAPSAREKESGADDKAAAGGTGASASGENPFPEDKSQAAAKAADKAADNSSNSTDAGSADDAAGVSSSRKEEPAGIAASLPNQGDTSAVPDPKRATNDLQIGKYYLDAGDYKGAYSRFREARSLTPDDAEVAFYLAEAARKMNQLDEAEKAYKLCLQLDPAGPRAKAARRALAGFDRLASR